MARAIYRTRQVVHALRPRIDDADLEYARTLLGEAQRNLFFAMERRDQRHALEVASRLRPRTDNGDLLTAALLHDCGKGAVPVWLRILNVLSAALLKRLADQNGPSWRRAAYRLAHHAQIGARLAAEVGSSATTVRLIRGEAEPREAPLLALLYAADDES
ncbi:MAG TPA: HD domain-containing protein [Dehalococcoidia bacterium]|nr:HD domain-containing protein [Dehalococcoidia bacterium]